MSSRATGTSTDMEPDERPWGTATVLDRGLGFQVKRLQVCPGRRLSLQSHQRRSEHWFVAAGVATAVVGEVEHEIRQGGSIDIPLGTRHRLGNSSDDDLVVIEMQRGEYFGDDDIHRYEDDFGRV